MYKKTESEYQIVSTSNRIIAAQFTFLGADTDPDVVLIEGEHENPDVDAKVLNASWDADVLKNVDANVVDDAGMEVEEDEDEDADEEEMLTEAFSVAVGLFLLWVDNRLSFLADFSIGMDGLWRDIGLRVEMHLDAVVDDVAEGCLDSSVVNIGVVDGVVDVTSAGGDSSF